MTEGVDAKVSCLYYESFPLTSKKKSVFSKELGNLQMSITSHRQQGNWVRFFAQCCVFSVILCVCLSVCVMKDTQHSKTMKDADISGDITAQIKVESSSIIEIILVRHYICTAGHFAQ